MSPEMAGWQMEKGFPVFVNVHENGVGSAAWPTRFQATKMAAASDALLRHGGSFKGREGLIVGRLKVRLKDAPRYPELIERGGYGYVPAI